MALSQGNILGNLIVPFLCLAGNSSEVFFTSYEKWICQDFFSQNWKACFFPLFLLMYQLYIKVQFLWYLLSIFLQCLILIFFVKFLVTYLVNAGLFSFSSVVTVKPGTLATWFRPGLQCTRTRGDEKKLVGLHRHKSSFLLHPCLFLWARTEGCQGDEVGLSPTAWSGKSSSLLWHLLRLEETETI